MKRGSSAGGLKVKALTWNVRDVSSSPAWHYTFCLYKRKLNLFESILVLCSDTVKEPAAAVQ